MIKEATSINLALQADLLLTLFVKQILLLTK